MKKEIILNIDENILLRFNMALQLNNESLDDVCELFMKKYFLESFSKETNNYENKTAVSMHSKNDYFGKALNKIAKWASKHHQINYKILRAYLQLANESNFVTYNDLLERCSDEEKHYDVYVSTFRSNFDQMKFDAEKSHGKVFIVDENNVITIWDYVADEVRKYADDFLKLHSTDIGYINKPHKQEVVARTNEKGTDHSSVLYKMKCTYCGYEYLANSTDIFQKKCPNCQGGVDTYVKKEMTNKDFVFSCMKHLRDNKIDVDKIMCLTDHEFCKEKFSCRKPILKQVDCLYNIPHEVINDYTNQPRFYKEPFDYNGTYFLITNYWYGENTNQPDNKTPFYNWVMSLTK